MKKIVIFDIDGTLADLTHRRHHLLGEEKDWDSFWLDMENDLPNEPMVVLCQSMFECGFRVLLCTGRPEKFREITDSWLSKHGIKYHEMRMRKDDDVRSDAIIKSELVEDIEPDQILFVVEDRARVTDMWRQKGVTCLQCDYGDF